MKAHFSRFLSSVPGRLHVAAHSHHPWPDVTFEAHQQAWLDAAAMHDDKWDRVMDEVLPEFQGHVARRLALPDPATVAVAPNTHELVVRLLSCLPDRPRILTSDGEFHSFTRQVRRLEEDGLVRVERVPTEPYGSFADRFGEAAAAGGHDLVFVSQVMFDSGLVVDDLAAVVKAVPDPNTFVVVDGYHGFMALPTHLSGLADRVFYLAGGYKYAMAGEGAVFMHCPPGYGPRPRDTGWFAGFEDLTGAGSRVGFADDGSRFLGATFDPSGLYRFNAVQRWLDAVEVDVPAIHRHVQGLQEAFLERLGASHVRLREADLLPGYGVARGHFLTFRLPDAGGWRAALRDRDVIVDHRGHRLRFGFGLYHDEDDVDALVERLARIG